MAKKRADFEDLVEEALVNAKSDRKLVLNAYDKLKGVLEVESVELENLQPNMLVGQNVIKLLEQASRANEQIVKLAQIKERQEYRESKKDADRKPMGISEMLKQAEEEGIDLEEEDVKIRVSEE